ncbi:hypothetical protein H5T54_04600 [Candidatus Bipolaricaulota bacterium]|nr:hypothetical protein [Candidatus Bipolaricaulota bacterium]
MIDDISELPPAVKTLAKVEKLLAELDDADRGRVLQWLNDQFRQGPSTPTATSGHQLPPVESQHVGEATDLAEFFAATQPATEAESVLVVGYWFQCREGDTELEAQKVNAALKDLGRQVTNITRTFDSLMGERPQLVVQTKKKGATKQARKRYKLTLEGKRRVEAMLDRARGTQ